MSLLMADDPTKVPFCNTYWQEGKKDHPPEHHFRATMSLPCSYLLALIGLLSVAGAVVSHERSELLAVLNGLRVAR